MASFWSIYIRQLCFNYRDIYRLYSTAATICPPDDLSDWLGILGLRKYMNEAVALSFLPHLSEAARGKINIYKDYTIHIYI